MYVALVTGNANQLTKFLIPSLIRVGDIERGTKIKCGTADLPDAKDKFLYGTLLLINT